MPDISISCLSDKCLSPSPCSVGLAETDPSDNSQMKGGALRDVGGLRPTLEPQVLRPYHRSEVITVAEAALIARKSKRTIRDWCQLHDIGRRIGHWQVSKVALAMHLEGDGEALKAYLRGDRGSPIVIAYFERCGVSLRRPGQAIPGEM